MLVLLAPLAAADDAPAALARLFAAPPLADSNLDWGQDLPRLADLYNAVLADAISAEFLAADRALAERHLAALDAIDAAALTAAERTSAATFRFNLELARERHASGFARKQALMPVSQFSGLHLELAQLGSGSGLQPFANAADHEAWLARAAGWPGWVDTAIADSARNRPEWAAPQRAVEPTAVEAAMEAFVRDQLRSGMAPAAVADLVHDAILANRFWIFTDPSMVAGLEPRYQAILTQSNPPTMDLGI